MMGVLTFCGRMNGNRRCYAPRSKKDPNLCENWHLWQEPFAIDSKTMLAELECLLARIDDKISKAEFWGAHLGELYSEAKGLRSRIAQLKKELKI